METIVEIKENGLPVIFNFLKQITPNQFKTWYEQNEELIREKLSVTGGVLFRNINITTVEDFENVLHVTSNDFLNYIDGNSPRTKLSSKIYTSTEYDKDHKITLHNELSYASSWPSKLFFCCLIPSEEGGETPIADSRQVLMKMNPSITKEFEEKGIIYIRNIHGGNGFSGRSWQETFETSDKSVVEKHCSENDIEFQWKQDGGLKLIQRRKGVIKHPLTNEKVWFNQADQFHPYQFDDEIYETLMMLYEQEEDMPTYVCYGDGSKISKKVINEIRETVDSVAVKTPWKKGDLLMVDNVLVAHGRMPYKGDRKIVVSMC